MYNYSTILSYKDFDDIMYRKEMLRCFDMVEYSDTINTKIGALYKVVKSHYKEIITAIKKNNNMAMVTGASEDECFMLLFSWDYFYDNHNLLNAINAVPNDKKRIIEMASVLLDKIIQG